MQQILRSHELNDHAHQKITELTSSFSEFITARKKSVYSIHLFLGYSQF